MGHRPAADPRLRFWAKVDVGTAERCWPWLASRHRNGYATFIPRHAGPRVMAHRFAYEDYRGPIADGMTIDHLCRNRACCNPWHMEVVSRGENSRRGGGSALGGAVVAKRAALTCPEGHPRTPEHARQDPDGRWRCKTCRRLKRARGDWV